MTSITAKNDEKNYRKTTVKGKLRGFATTPLDKWTREITEAQAKINTHLQEENTIHKFMTKEEWNNAHWNEGEGDNLPYNCKNEYLQLNSGGKHKWMNDNILNTSFKYTLQFYKVPAAKELPGEIITIGENWIMKLSPTNTYKDVYLPHRTCGDVIIGVMMPENTEFDFNKLGDKITHFEQPKTSFEYRGIYGFQA